MAAPPPLSAPRRRPRPGSPERPVNSRMYRGTWLLLAVPLLLAAFSVSRPTSLPRPSVPPVFDADAAYTLATEFARFYPDRFPGTPGARTASDWFERQLAPYGLKARADRFETVVAGYGKLELENLRVVVVGDSPRTIVITAHRDNLGVGPGANDNGSGTAALIALARAYARPAGARGESGPRHTLVFLSTDGGALGGLGAAHYAAQADPQEIAAVVNLDSLAARAPARLQVAGDRAETAPEELVRSAATEIVRQTGQEPTRPTAFRQLVDLAFPFNLYEHAPFVGRGIPAITITTAGDRPEPAVLDTAARLAPQRLTQLGQAAQILIASLDEAVDEAQGTPPAVYLGARVVRGWAIELTLATALLPFFAAAVDLFARCRRRRIALAPALRSYRSRLGFWLFVGGVFGLFALLGLWPDGVARPLALESDAAHAWPLGALVALGVLAASAWLVARERLIPRRAVSADEELAGHTTALLALGVLSLLVVATNPFALIFVLPSLHAWLWLPQVRDRPVWLRAGILAAGFAGPVLLVALFATRFGLGLDAPWYLAELTALGYVPLPLVVVFLGWLAAAGQLSALAVGRYAPYPDAHERPPRGPIREIVRRILLAFLRRRRASVAAREALEA